MVQELTPDRVRVTCLEQDFGCVSSKEIDKLEAIIGQERAIKALKFGLGIREKGFNIFVSGMPGTGRTTAVKLFLEEIAKGLPTPPDWCYVNNFQDTTRPKALRLPAGKARQFKSDLNTLVEGAEQSIRTVFESEEYAANKEKTVKTFQDQKESLFDRVNKFAQEKGFALQASPMGIITIPLRDGKPMSEEDFMALKTEERDEISKRQQVVQAEIATSIRQSRQVDKSVSEAIQTLDREVALYAIQHMLDEMKEKYTGLPEVTTFMEDLCNDILDRLPQFRSDESEQPLPQQMMSPQGQAHMNRELQRRRYEVAIIVDNTDLSGAPVILETNPTYNNLMGAIEHEAQFGTLVTDFTLLRGGALQRANGGYLVLPVEEILRNAITWESMKRALVTNEVVIEDATEKMGVFATKSLRPTPIPLDLKVILIGTPQVYELLRTYDQEFPELFKVKADFDTQMERTGEHIQEFVAFISKLVNNENLKHLDTSALAKIIEHGSRLADNQKKLSTHFGVISDVVREASYYAAQEGVELISEKHIREAIEQRFYRSNLYNERMMEMIGQNVIKIDTAGSKVGQVNGLSVVGVGDTTFGQPSRITASIGLGRKGLVDIEREAEMSGPIHTKGVLILSGFLNEKFAQDKPLSLSAHLTFEQNYGGVEGDSASSTELYCILSALSGLPIQQSFAVTGSVNQKGEVQAIGGVNEKIEGFFEVCKIKGLTGAQGVLIPDSNVLNLMLKDEVVDAIKAGKFHIYPIRTIEEGVELLTGIPAGKRREDGTFEPNSVFARTDQRLKELAEKLVGFGKGE
jgi:lon-related putative ATP-dependent protease